MKLKDLYDLHDDFEVLLRKLQRLGLLNHRLGAAVWSGHDLLERLIIVNQARVGEHVLDAEEETDLDVSEPT